jgi:spoIIIJ-associated protein
MSEWREVSGTTRDEAVSEAVRVLGVAEADMQIDDVDGDGDGVTLRVRVAAVEVEVAASPSPTQTDESDRGSDAVESDGGGSDVAADALSPEDERALQEEQKEIVLDFLVDLLEAFDLEGEIAAEHREDALYVDINGEDLGSLIGRRGMTLAALIEITRTVVQRRTASRVRLQLDVQGYRARRRVALEEYATQLAREVQESGVEKALEPMPPSERKIVHDAVGLVDGVRSYSEGQDPRRNVVIGPA